MTFSWINICTYCSAYILYNCGLWRLGIGIKAVDYNLLPGLVHSHQEEIAFSSSNCCLYYCLSCCYKTLLIDKKNFFGMSARDIKWGSPWAFFISWRFFLIDECKIFSSQMKASLVAAWLHPLATLRWFHFYGLNDYKALSKLVSFSIFSLMMDILIMILSLCLSVFATTCVT